MKEDAATIRKAMAQINTLREDDGTPEWAQSLNQLTRWVMTKEEHADKIIDRAAHYMLAQRVKEASFPRKEDYHLALELHHKLMQAAMKSKQSVKSEVADALDHAVADVGAMYTSE